MASSSRDSPSKRALERTEDEDEGKSKEKRPRIVSDISEVSEADDLDTNVVKDDADDNLATEVIYELSSDNDESLCKYHIGKLWYNSHYSKSQHYESFCIKYHISRLWYGSHSKWCQQWFKSTQNRFFH